MHLLKTILPLIFFLLSANISEAASYTLKGNVRTASGESLQRASVSVSPSESGTVTDSTGTFSISLPSDKYTITVSYLGYSPAERHVDLNKDTTIAIVLNETSVELGSALVTSQVSKTETAETGMEKLTADNIKSVPALFGEIDPLKVVQLTPGVQSSSEGSSGFSVRGGNIDQNLILLDGATIYNPSHVMGFFSVFNNDVLEELKLYKGDMPAMYGGRLAALVDIRTREGNMQKYGVNGGIGLISSRILVEGPIVKDKLSFLVSGRRTYLEIFKPFVAELEDKTMHFYDLNLSLAWQISPKSKLNISGYMGRDSYGIKDALLKYGNRTLTMRLSQTLSRKLFFNLSILGSQFDNDYTMNVIKQLSNQGSWWLRSYGAKADMAYYYGEHTLEFGYHIMHHNIMKGKYAPNSSESINTSKYIHPTSSLEQALYVSNEFVFGKFSARTGVRLNGFYNISNGRPITILDNYQPSHTETYPKGKIYKKRYMVDPRLGLSFRIDDRQTIKASYTRTSQFLQMALNNASGLPINTWFESSANIRPQLNDQYSVGYYRDIKGKDYEFSFEVYYKDTKNAVDFKDHAKLTYNYDLEQDVRMGKGYSYGLEVMLRKNTGRLNGWITYFFTRSMKKIDTVNGGRWYRSIYDKPVNITIVANYELSDKWSLSANWILASGTPTSYPTGRAYVGDIYPENNYIPVYSGRNNSRYPTYHRLDISATLKLRTRRMEQSELVFSMYNAYGRKNPWSIKFNYEYDNTISAEMYYLFTFTPSVTWNFKF